MVVVKLGTSEAVSAGASPPPRSCRMLEGRNVVDDVAKAAAQQQTNAATLRTAAPGICFID
jgi:hypothetical protein